MGGGEGRGGRVKEGGRRAAGRKHKGLTYRNR